MRHSNLSLLQQLNFPSHIMGPRIPTLSTCGSECRRRVGGPMGGFCALPGSQSLPPWSTVGEGGWPQDLRLSLRGQGCPWRWGGNPHLPSGRSPRQPWHKAFPSQEGQVTETDKSICQEGALEKESLNSLSQEAQKGNCSLR